MNEVRKHGHEGVLLRHNFPHVAACIREVAGELRRLEADILCCSGYKPDVLGWGASRLARVPVLSVSHGWTAASWKVCAYELLDRLLLRRMDAVVCVSRGQAEKVRRAWVPEAKITVIQNAIGEEAFVRPDLEIRAELTGWFAQPPRWVVGAAGRLSPEKGFAVYIDAAARVTRSHPETGFVLFGDGPLRARLERQIAERGLLGRFVLAGFREDLSRFLSSFDVGVLSSFTEGLPVTLLELCAAHVPVVATSVGGIAEVIEDGRTGRLAPAGDAAALADCIVGLLDDAEGREAMGRAARARVRNEFSFERLGQRYYEVFERLLK
jgi:glycosyltransferase involved in cell wall biosynthesis